MAARRRETGTAGTQILSGPTGPPSNTIGSNGDFYVDTLSGDFYGPKTGGNW
jgi:hypothetical protein